MWVVVKVGVPFWVLNIIRHLIFMVPKRDHNFDNYPCSMAAVTGILFVIIDCSTHLIVVVSSGFDFRFFSFLYQSKCRPQGFDLTRKSLRTTLLQGAVS